MAWHVSRSRSEEGPSREVEERGRYSTPRAAETRATRTEMRDSYRGGTSARCGGGCFWLAG